MKKIFSIIAAFLAGAMMFSCADPMEDTLELGTEISVDTEKIDFEAENNEAVTVNVTANGTWMVAAPQWLKVTPMMGEAGTTAVTITATDNMETVVKEDGSQVVEMAAPRAYDLVFAGEDACVKVSAGVDKETGEETFKYVQATATVKVSQVGDPEKAKAIDVTIAEFNAAAEDLTKYRLTGVITSIEKEYYGNIYIEDETASTYIYGLYMKNENGELIKYDVVKTLGIKVGDTLVVEGTRGSYKETIEMIGALYISHTPAEGGETPEPEPEPEVVTATIGEIAAEGKYKVESATILASYARGYLLGDSTGKMLAYLGADHGLTLVAGDVVTVEGSVSIHNGFAQFTAGSTLTKTGTAEVNHGEAEVLDGAGMDAYLTAPAFKYVSYTGTLSISGYYYNVNVEGAATAVGSISYPVEGMVDAALNGKKVVVTGYAIGTSSDTYVNTMATSVVEAEGGEGGETPEPEITTSTFGAITAEGTYKVENATVVAVTTKGYLLYDTTGYAYVYVGKKTDYAVGTKMTVTGAVTYYYKMMQIAPTTVEDVTTVEVTHPEAEEINGAAIDAYMSAPTYKYVKVTGKLSVDSFTNLIVEGTTNTVSVSYFDGDLSALNEKDVTLYGYLGGSNTSKGYATMYLVSYEEVAADEPSEVTAYTMTLGVTAGEDGKFAPNSNISGLAKSFKEHTWTATDDSGKDTITFTGDVYYRDGDASVWYFNKKNPGTTVSAEGFGKLKKVTITLLGEEKDRRLPALLECKDKEGNVVASNETEKSLTMTYEFANATDGFTLTGKNDQDAEDSNYQKDLKVTSVVIEYEK